MKINIISKTTVLCLLCFLLCHAVVVCAQNEGGWFRLSADDVKPAKTPNIAIINKHNDKTLADLLFAELAKDNKISLVERERLDLILKEQEYSSTSRNSNIKLGKLLKADALLFIEPDKDLIHIRLVETDRGIRLSDDIFGKKTKIEEIAKIIQTRISNLSSKLLLKPENRIFISLLPVIPESKSSYTSKKGIPDNIILTINTLLGVHLFNGEGVLMPERENLSDIVSEKKIQEEKSQSALSFADVVIRFKPITKKDKKITLQLQIIPKGKPKISLEKEIRLESINEDIAKIAKEILSKIGSVQVDPKISIAEAALYFLKGECGLGRNEYRNAMRYFELAYLLDDSKIDYKCGFASALKSYLIFTNKTSERYPFMIDQLDKLITLTERTNNDSLKGYICSSYYKCGDKPYLIYKFLYDSEQHYPTEKIQLLKDIKIRIRKIFESVCISKEKDPNQIRYLLRFTPVFFSEPEDAIKYIKPYMQEQKLYGDVLVSINFDNIPAWKRKKGGKVWLDFLNSFKKSPEKYYQFYALKSLFTRSTKGLYNPPRNPKCLIEYLDWLSIPENVTWLAENYEGVRNDLTNTFLMPIECSENLPIEQRLNLASKFIIPLWIKSKHFDDRTFNNHFWTILRFLNKEYIKCRKENITKFNNTLKKELNIALETIDNRYPKAKKEHRDILRKFALIELFPEFQKKRIIHDNPPEIKGAQIIYDYADDSPDWKTEKNDDFYGFCSVFGVERIALLCEKNIIWLVYGIKEGVRVIRIDLLDKKSQTTIDVKIERLYTTDDIQLCRFKDFLGISYASKITMIPVISKKPYLDTDSKRVKILGREITPNVTLGMSFHDNQDQQVLTMIPGEKSLYLCTKKQWNRKISLSGIYRWQEGMDKCEEVRSATSLKIGMFNDCSPHSVFGGSKVDNGNLILFVKFHPENEAQGKISGIWQYNLGLDKFSLIQKDNFHNLAHYFANQNKSPKRFSASHFYYLVDIGTCYMVNKKTGKLRMLANPFEYIRDFDNFFPYNEKQDLLGVNRLLVENEWGKELLKYDTSLKKEICLFKPEDREFFLHTTVLSDYGPVLLFVQSVPDPTLKSPDKMVERRLILYHMPNRKEPTISQRKTIHNNEDNK